MEPCFTRYNKMTQLHLFVLHSSHRGFAPQVFKLSILYFPLNMNKLLLRQQFFFFKNDSLAFIAYTSVRLWQLPSSSLTVGRWSTEPIREPLYSTNPNNPKNPSYAKQLKNSNDGSHHGINPNNPNHATNIVLPAPRRPWPALSTATSPSLTPVCASKSPKFSPTSSNSASPPAIPFSPAVRLTFSHLNRCFHYSYFVCFNFFYLLNSCSALSV